MHGVRLACRPGWALLLAFSAVPLVCEAACYQLFDKKDRLVLQSTRSPVDLSKSISEEVALRYPGHTFVAGASGACPEVDELNRSTVQLPAEPLKRGPIQLSGDMASVAAQQRAARDSTPVVTQQRPAAPYAQSPVTYRNCAEARKAGATPIRKGQPGYSARLDKDGDGVACE